MRRLPLALALLAAAATGAAAQEGHAAETPSLMSPNPGLMIWTLVIFVAFLQAFIFAMLASVFIGQMVEAHH